MNSYRPKIKRQTLIPEALQQAKTRLLDARTARDSQKPKIEQSLKSTSTGHKLTLIGLIWPHRCLK